MGLIFKKQQKNKIKKQNLGWVGYLMSILGACIGLGNIWRFPFLLSRDGGGAFLIAYIVGILVIGIPIFILETTLGGKLRLSVVKTWELLSKKKIFRMLGWIGVAITLVILIYYQTIFSWTIRSFINSFIPSIWRYQKGTIHTFAPAVNLTHFNQLGSFHYDWAIIIILIWIVTVFVLLKGIVGTIEKINVYGIFIKLVLIAILFIYVLTLKGSATGLNYLFEIKWGDLRHINIWSDAFSQIFFTSSLVIGIIFAYARHAKKDQEINLSAPALIFTNGLVAICISVLIYSMLGWFYVHFNGDFGQHWNNISDFFNSPTFKDNLSGPGLLFNLIPTTLGALNHNITYLGSIIGICFYLAVIFATFTCFLSMVVAVTECIKETYKTLPMWFIICITIFPGIIFNIFLCFKYSTNLIDPIDHYVENYLYLIAGMFELIIFCWIVRFNERKIYYDYANRVSGMKINIYLYNFVLKYLSLFAVGAVLIYSIVNDIQTDYYEVLFSYHLEFWFSLIVGLVFPISELIFLEFILDKINTHFIKLSKKKAKKKVINNVLIRNINKIKNLL